MLWVNLGVVWYRLITGIIVLKNIHIYNYNYFVMVQYGIPSAMKIIIDTIHQLYDTITDLYGTTIEIRYILVMVQYGMIFFVQIFTPNI